MIAPPTKMTGSDKQVEWAQKIKGEIQLRYPGEPLPDVSYAKFWIDNRDATPTQLCKRASTEVHSPFTATYPRITRSDVEPLLRNMHNFAVVDTETSGLPSKANAEIVEMTIVAVTSDEVLFNSLFKPHDMEDYLKSEARKMHAFPEEDYLKAPTFPEEWETIQLLLSHYHLVSYNAEFDFPMLRRTAQIWGLPAPHIKATCAMKMFHAFMNTETASWQKEKTKLSEAREVMGVDQEKFGAPHTALADTLALRELLLRMRDTVEGTERSSHDDYSFT